MDEDCDSSVLVIDLDDEREENQDAESYIDDENGRINAINVNYTNFTANKSVRQNSNDINQVNISSLYRYDDRYSDDDDIQVIDDDDDDYEGSVRKLVIVANKVGREYLKNKHSNVEDYRNQKSDNHVHKNVTNRGCLNRLNPTTLHETQNQVNKDISRDRVQRCVKVDHPTQRSGCEPNVCQARYVSDEVPYFVDKKSCRPSRADVEYRIETPQGYRHANMYQPEAVSIDEYNAAVNRYAHHIYRPEDDLSKDYCRDAATNTSRYIYSPQVLSIDDYRRVTNRDRNSHTFGPEQALNMSQHSHSAIHRDINNHVYVSEIDLTNEGYSNHASNNRHLYHYTHRPELALSKRDACSNNHQPEENSSNDECRYIYATRNGFPYTHAHEVDALHDYWQIMNRHAYRPEIINVDDYGCAEINRSCNGYRLPAVLSSDPYRSDLTNFYRSAFLDPKLTKHSYPEAVGMYYFPQLSHFNAYRPYDDAHKKDEAILNLSRKPELSKETTRDENLDGCKLRTILSTSSSKYEQSNIHVDKLRKIETYRPTVDNAGKINTVWNSNKLEAVQMSNSKQGVPLRINRSTVILDTNNVCQTGTSKTQFLTDVLPTTNTKLDHYDHSSHTVAKKIHNDSLINAKGRVMHNDSEINEGRQKNIVIERDIDELELNSKIRFLVVFFTRVKELVKETFPEFSKSLEIETKNLGKMANSGKVKTDIQFICPLYCSESTYSLPLFGSIDEDNKIEKHINRNTICDVCSCIQNCYKLYKKKYFNLLYTKTNKIPEIENKKGRKRKINTLSPELGSNRERTVISCTLKYPNCEENKCDNGIEIDNESRKNTGSKNEGNLHKASLENNAQEVADDVIKYPSIRLNEKTLLDSLSISNFNVPVNNIDKDKTHKNKMDIEKRFQKAASNENVEISVSKSTLDKDSHRDEAEGNLSLRLPHDEITNSDNADIISSRLKNKTGRRPDAVFTCHICSCIFIYFASFVSHMRKEHDVTGIEEDIPDECVARKCPFCGIYSKQKYHNEHVKRAHPQIFTHKGEPTEILNVDKKSKFKKRKFIFTCLVCHKNLKSTEVKRHREKEHKGVNVAKMFTKKLSTLDN